MQIKNLLTLLALLLLSVSVHAGYSQPAPVMIDTFEGGGNARGDMIAARNSENDLEFIGCGTRAFDFGGGSVYHWGFCQAGLEEGASVTCFVEDDLALLEGINTISDSSYISFSWTDDGAGNLTCDSVGSSTQSFYLEKGQKSK